MMMREAEWMGGVSRTYTFNNGLRMSAVCFPGSYGGGSGLWEIAVFDESGGWATEQFFPGEGDTQVIGWVGDLQPYIDTLEAYDNLH